MQCWRMSLRTSKANRYICMEIGLDNIISSEGVSTTITKTGHCLADRNHDLPSSVSARLCPWR